MRTLLTLGANSSTPRRHGSGQNNENITNARGKLEHSTKTWKWTNNENITNSRESTPRRHGSAQNNENITNTRDKLGTTRALGKLELHDMEVDKIMRTLLTLGANSNTPRRHGSGQNNENITNTRDKLEHFTKIWKWTK